MSLLFGAIIGTVGTIPPDFMDQIVFVAIAMAILSGIVLIVRTIWYFLFVKIASSISQRVQTKYLAAVLSKDIEWFDRCSPAELTSRLSSDIEKVQSAIASIAGQFMMGVRQAIAGIVIGFTKGWQIARVCRGCLPVIMVTRILDSFK
jgi:ABC-type multidrug transport system fused ATPase/permease subunit